MNKNGLIGILILAGVFGGMLLFWQVQAERMEDGFVEAMRAGQVEGFTIDLRDKTWSEDELATAEVVKLDKSYSKERSLLRTAHTGGGYTLSRKRFAYQATVTDLETGIKHVFGYTRQSPGRWRYETIHPDSSQIHIERRGAQVEEMFGKQ